MLVAWVANTSISRKRPSWGPTIIPQAAKSSLVEASADARCPGGAVVCASAYAWTSGLISSAMAPMVGAVRDPLLPDQRAQPEQPAHVVDVGVEEGDRDEDVGRPPELGLLLGLAPGHDAEVEEALRHLSQ